MRRQDARKARLLDLIREAGTAAELARRAGVNPAYISQIVTGTKLPSGKARNVGDEMAQKLERGMGKPVGWMDTTTGTVGGAEGGGLAHAPAPRGRVPVISSVQAGHFKDIVDNHHPGEADEWIDIGVQVRRHTFGLIVEGDSMEPEFTEGMRIVVEPDMAPEIGDYVVAGNGEQATLKKLVRDGNDLYLKPLNPRYPIKPLGDARIIGVVREAHRKYR